MKIEMSKKLIGAHWLGLIIFLALIILSFIIIIPLVSHAEKPSMQEETKEQQDKINNLEPRIKKLEEKEVLKDIAVDEKLAGTKSRFGFNFGLFGDVNYSSNRSEETKNSFFIGEVDLYGTGNFGDRINFLVESVFEEIEKETKIDMERFWIGYTFNDLFITRVGKFHTALGYWNKTYHHGKQLFTTIYRPFFLEFEDEDGIMPVHIFGMEIEGSKATESARFKYEFELGTGPRISMNQLKPNNISDDNSSKQFALRLSMMPYRITGLTFGVSGSTYAIKTSRRNNLNEYIIGADISYTKLPWEFVSEYFGFYNSTSAAAAFYIQLAYSLPYSITPYARYERLDMEGDDPYFIDLDSANRNQTVVGLKYDFDIIHDIIHNSIKAQYRYDDKKNDKTRNVFELQWAINF